MPRVRKSTIITAAILVAIVIVIIIALFMEAAAGPSFRAEDHANLQECMGAIPTEWGPGSFQRDGAEQACMYVHGRPR